jgi:Protein of unknown function (DUF1593)
MEYLLGNFQGFIYQNSSNLVMKRMKMISLITGIFILFIFPQVNYSQETGKKLRILVLTDIENEPDDSQSLIRFLTYSNQWDVEGLIATTSVHMRTTVAPETILKILGAYKKVYPNLLKHEKGYPAYDELKLKVKKGLPVYGMGGVGKGKDSEGSDWIIKVLEKKDDRPVWIPVWGGANTLAQALWKIKETKNTADAEKLYSKIRIYTISDQDDANPWIRKTFPGIFFICSPGYTYRRATWLGMSSAMPGSNKNVVSNEWIAKNIQQGHGPLGAAYPDVAYGMEGDTPSFLSLISNGLNDPEHPDYGGWGGRYEFYTPVLPAVQDSFPGRPDIPLSEKETGPFWTNAEDSVFSTVDNKGYKSIQATIWRWREEYQNDFAARIGWTTKNYNEVNHPPIPKLAHSDHLTVRSGEQFHLNAAGTIDPDGDSMSYLWFQYPEAGTYRGLVSFRPYASNLYNLTVTAPLVDSAQTIHFILKVSDKGTPQLTRYKRVIVMVLPKGQ